MNTKRKLNHAIWAIVPAAGIGKRMLSDIPKQYLLLNNRPILEHTLNTLLTNKHVSGLVVALQPDDEYFSTIKIRSNKPVLRAPGGKERADSVLYALEVLFADDRFDENSDWVMVHDAVRACLRQDDIDKLVLQADADNGGLLALPVRDTMKRQAVDENAENNGDAMVAETIDRENLWHALTPQYFQANKLKKALTQALQGDLMVTDESSAMEFAGFTPRLVQGHEDNIKITRPDDLYLASQYLQSQT